MNTLLTLPDNTMPDESLITQRIYSVPERFAFRLSRYFGNQFTGARRIENPDMARNCFHFGLWMARGIAFQTRNEATKFVFQKTQCTPPIEQDRVGEHSIIRPLAGLPREPVLHSLVKLDDVSDDYVQIMARGGGMGITSATETIAYYETGAFRELVAPRLGVDPTIWAVGHFSASAALQRDY